MAECFLSYSHAPLDQVALSEIRAVLTGSDVTYWFDGYLTVQRGLSLNQEIANEMRTASVVVLLLSSQYVSSSYCQAEACYALENDKPIIRVDAEPFKIPATLLPLSAIPAVKWHDVLLPDFQVQLVSALARCGIDASRSLIGTEVEPLFRIPDQGDVALVRPSYYALKSTTQDALREIERRLIQAQISNPQNGYNYLSLAFLWLHKGDSRRAIDAARKAVDLLGNIPYAYFAEALAFCASKKPAQRSKEDVENILRRLAIARRLPKSGAHIDLLSGIVISNYYLPKYLTPPAEPDELLKRGLSLETPFNKSEVARVLETEPIIEPQYLPSLEFYVQRARS